MAFDPNQTSDSYLPGEAEWATKFAAQQNLASAARLAANNLSNDDAAKAGAGTVAAPTSTSGQSNTPSTQNTGQKSTNSAGSDFSNNRTDNPLNNFSSYTYSIVLYAISPEDANKYAETGQTPTDRSKYYVVAQSGGISSADSRAITSSGNPGPNQMGLDYFIDTLEFRTTIPNTASQSYAQGSRIKLKIIEPYGFNFTEELKKLTLNISKKSPLMKGVTADNFNHRLMRYILGIRYYGYDSQGNLVTSKSGFVKNYNNGFSDVNSVIERYVVVAINDFKFKVNGNSTTYNIELQEAAPQASLGTITGVTQNPLNINGSTVGEVLAGSKGTNSKSLVSELNNQTKKSTDSSNKTEQSHTYEIEFLDEKNNLAPNGPIASAKISVSDAKTNTGSGAASNTSQSNIAAAFKTQTYNSNIKSVGFNAGTDIVQIIDDIISKSSYVSNALKVLNNEKPETGGVKNTSRQEFKWFSINPIVTTKSFEKKTNYWTFNIKYQIKPYTIYYIKSNNVTSFCKFNGAHKVYNYFLTGENTQVLNYELQYNALYFIAESSSVKIAGQPDYAYTASNTSLAKNSTQPIPSAPQGGSQSSVGGVGINNETVPQENVRAQLYSPSDAYKVTMKIMGDPDWILTSTGINATQSKFKAMPKVKSLSGTAADLGPSMFDGQLLVQVIFNTANDYLNTGLMDVSDQVMTMAPGTRNFNIKGTIFTVSHVTSLFSKGSFTQTLEMQLVPSNLLVTENSNSSTDGRESSTTLSGTEIGSSDRPTLSTGDFIAADARATTDASLIESQSQSAQDSPSNNSQGVIVTGQLGRQERQESANDDGARNNRAALNAPNTDNTPYDYAASAAAARAAETEGLGVTADGTPWRLR